MPPHEVAGLRPLYVEASGRLWASRGMRIYSSVDHGRSFEFVAKYRGDLFQRASRASRLVERFTRSGFLALVPRPDGGCVAVVRGRILTRGPGTDGFREAFRIVRGSRPLNICLLPDGRLYWGEYFFNQRRDEVHVYGSDDGGESWDVVYTFPAGRIRHVHGIFYDPFRSGCWVLTGDDDRECKVLFADERFRNPEPVFEGSQQFRSVTVIPREDCLITGTDSPFQQNYIQRLDPKRGCVERIRRVPGSVFFGCIVGDFLVISVATEPSRINTSKFASLWMSQDGDNWRQLYQAKRDRWQMPYCRGIPDHIAELPLFQHGAFVIPPTECVAQPILYAYGQSLVGHDDQLLCWDLNTQKEFFTSGRHEHQTRLDTSLESTLNLEDAGCRRRSDSP
ncbi:MAG TPA: hypothetical protein PK384_02945 [Candidatus Latescibacteria bacterium]|nr:hypothetical protein [Candidatus Latescibacterota bacterium]